MKIKTTFPYEVILIDSFVLLIVIILDIIFAIQQEWLLMLLLTLSALCFFGLLTFLIYLFSRFYININEYVEIRKYFKISKYKTSECSFDVKEINETVNGDLIYILTITCDGVVVLKINSNSFDSVFRTKYYVNKLLEYNNLSK